MTSVLPVVRSLAILAITLSLAGCGSRPDAAVLDPVAVNGNVGASGGKHVTIIAATNRTPDKQGYSATWADRVSYQQYDMSIPPKRDGAVIRYPTAHPDPQYQFMVRSRRELTTAQFLTAATSGPNFDGTVGIFVHGFNYSYQEALYRAAQVAADADTPTAPIMFSWPSQAAIAGYVADKDAVLYSRTELQDVIDMVSKARGVKRVVLFGHSMGAFLVMEAVRQLKLEQRTGELDKLAIILAAPDIDLDVFRSQLADIGRMKTPVTLLVSKTDRALQVSSILGGERPRVGRLDVSAPQIEEIAKKDNLRVIDISSVQGTDGLGHDRYASIAKFGTQLASFETQKRRGAGDAGAFVFDAAGDIVSAPFRLVGGVVGTH